MVHIYNGILLSRKDEYLPFASTWMELEGVMLSEASQAKKDNYHKVSLICGIKGIAWRKLREGREK